MSEEVYRCVCHTCDTERLIEGLENAQECFNEHADRSHEVELFNRETRHRYAGDSTDESTDGSEGESETESGTTDE